MAAALKLRGDERGENFFGRVRRRFFCRSSRGRSRRCAGGRARRFPSSPTSAARTPATLLAVMLMPTPLVQTSRPSSAWPSATASATGLREIGIIIRRVFRGRAEIADGQAAFAQERLSVSLSSKPPWSAPSAKFDDAAGVAGSGVLVRRLCCSINFKSVTMPCSIWSRHST